MDASQEQTDVSSFAVLEPTTDGFRNYVSRECEESAAALLLERSNLMTLTAPEMAVLLGGMRALCANFGQSEHGVFTKRPETLSNDFFVNLLDLGAKWTATSDAGEVFQGTDRKTSEKRWTATRADLIFGSNTELRAIAEVYACDDAKEKFVNDFVAAWAKVMNNDRFDLKR
jgi:catalase-peroxidase